MPIIRRKSNAEKYFAGRLAKRLNEKQNRLDKQPGILGDGQGRVTVAGLPNFVYVSIGDKALPVFNNRVIPQAGVKVWVGYSDEEPTLYQVLSTRSDAPSQANDGGFTGYAPAKRYEWLATNGGQDPLHVHNRAISFLKLGVSAQGGMYVNVFRGFIWTGTVYQHIDSADTDLTSYIPATSGKAAFVLVTISTAGTITFTDGADVDIALLDVDADIPAPPADTAFVCGAVRVYNGQTEVREARTNSDIVDLRFTQYNNAASLGLDSTYLRLDASNDPLTNGLTITPTTNVNALTANGKLNVISTRTTTGVGGDDRLSEFTYTVASDNATANRFPYAIQTSVITSGSTNFGGISEVSGGLLTTSLAAAITTNSAVGFKGRVVVNNASSTTTAAYGVYGQLVWNAAGSITTGAAVTALLSGVKYGTNLYLFLGQLTQSNVNATNIYGLYLPAISGATTLNYAIFTNAGLINFGDQVKIDGSANRIQEIVQGHSTQTANLVEWQNSSATVLGYVSGTGTVKTSGRRQAVATKTANYTLTVNDEVVVFTGTTNGTFTLPAATGTGQTYRLCNETVTAGVSLTIDGNASETIKGSLTQTLYAGEDLILTDYASGKWA